MKPNCKTDKIIGDYIQNHQSGELHTILTEDERLEAAWYLSEMANGLFGWYPFDREGTVLQVGSWFGAFTEMLRLRCKKITIVEHDPYRAFMTEKRLKDRDRVVISNAFASDYCKTCHEKFDYIVFAVDETIDAFKDVAAYKETLEGLKSVLGNRGKLLWVLPNRLGVKYFCGAPDPYTNLPFDGMTEHNSGLYRFDREELLEFARSLGFPYIKLYYAMPDHHSTQLIYTDAMRPGMEALERLNVYSDNKTGRLLDEWVLTGILAKNGIMHCFANSFLLEAGFSPCSGVIYSAISTERDRIRAFATNIFDNDTVEKIPLYEDGRAGIRQLLDNSRELSGRGIPVLKMEERDGGLKMGRIRSPSLSVHLKEAAQSDRNSFIKCIDRLRAYILDSSDHVAAEKNCMRSLDPRADWGVILKKAYIEMIPVNSFWDKGDILFYDQEFTKENCPADYVLFRALRDIYAFSPDIEQSVPLDDMKERYGLMSTWEYYAEEEERFQTELRRRNIYRGFYHWIEHLFATVQKNRCSLVLPGEKRDLDYFNVVQDLRERRIILFGAGQMAEYYLEKYGKDFPPAFLVDNNADKWGSRKSGIEIKNPSAISKLMGGTYWVIVAVKNFEPIVKQLEDMGIGSDSYRICLYEIDSLISGKLVPEAAVLDGKFNMGYTAGSFDGFHMKHLEFLRKCKMRSHYLTVGVYTDEMMEQTGAPRARMPLKERMEMVKQCRYVDRAVESHSVDEIKAWKLFRYGCLFADISHEKQNRWIWLRRKLRTLGSEVEFL